MNVLSLFDGMSCGRIALERAGIEVKNYFASEIDEAAIKVSKDNWKDITHMGDVTRWKEWDIEWDSIDLLIGGSPCQGFSFAGKMLMLDDPRSKLFFTYSDILNHIRKFNPSVKFMLENTYMKQGAEDVISSFLGTDPFKLDSNAFCAQNRRRLYWTNILLLVEKEKLPKIPCNLYAKNILSSEVDYNLYLKGRGLNKLKSDRCRVIKPDQKFPCLMATQSSKPTDAVIIEESEGVYRYPTRNEMERMQTVPDNYTNSVSYNDAAKMLGNGWTVEVIAHIFSHLNNKEINYDGNNNRC